MKVSNCCGAPFYEPGYPDNDICSACKEHADAVDDEEVLESKEANQRATNKVSIETAKEIVHHIMGGNNNG